MVNRGITVQYPGVGKERRNMELGCMHDVGIWCDEGYVAGNEARGAYGMNFIRTSRREEQTIRIVEL